MAKSVDAADLKQLSACGETCSVEGVKNGETLAAQTVAMPLPADGNAVPRLF